MPLTCASFRPVQDQQTLRSCFPQVISSQPAPRPEMIIGPPSKLWLEKDSLEDAQRLRGGGMGCACCGGGGNTQQASPLEPQPELTENKPVREEQPAPKAPSKQQVPRLSLPTPPSQASQAGPSEKPSSATRSTGATLQAPSRSTRTYSSPAAPSIPPAPQSSEQSRDRRQTLPSKLSPNKSNQVSSPSGPPPIPEGFIDYGGGIMRSPAFPPSVHIAGGSRKGAGGPPPVTAPFMKD
ncbi:unnamed protein product [Rhizoctonia solani]|uniref:Uncharacterized protein n=1 Tax=Rhizoctonia solani TaxID=456999 RepID=A0A8H3HZE7_9AGAM|nr:unnamed protein product [Rhizoctonia solani]